jgi:predicted ATP-grasp superfamily ATP-dependent carboligase
MPDMHIFLYEWATGGGLVEEPGSLPPSLLREGAAMVGALAADLTRIEGARVTVLRDPRVLNLALPGCELVDVLDKYSQAEELERLANAADATLLIAPEFDRILLDTARRVVAAGGRLASPSPAFITVAADKHKTCNLLSAAGVPTPPGVLLESDDSLPRDFQYPAVVKPVDGAGSQDTYLVSGPHDTPPEYAWPRRLERYMPGLPASVAVLCGPGGRVSLAPCKQRISEDGRLRYQGGELPLAPGLAERATALAERALSALPSTIGYVGVDIVLGRNPNGDEDAVIEVNPRLTTSYVGLRAASLQNLAKAMMLVNAGNAWKVDFSNRPIEFDPSGNASFMQ